MRRLREYFSVVNQPPYLFNTTIDENIAMNKEIDVEMLTKVCNKTGVDNFVNQLPLKYKYKTGIGGTKLSGGESQKVAVARAFYKNAEVFIFDEATAGYDNDSNIVLYNQLYNKLEEKTVIFITHRYEELQNVDKILQIKNAKVQTLKN